jgi:hypothetical protein
MSEDFAQNPDLLDVDQLEPHFKARVQELIDAKLLTPIMEGQRTLVSKRDLSGYTAVGFDID